MIADEKLVRDTWALVHVSDGSYRHYAKGTILIQERNHKFWDFQDWQAAADFTRERLKEIGELRELIAFFKRIIQRLESELCDLRWGMKESA